ncbi:MAG: right-handed parallel beta-helix repeat-containing protein [Bryobacterales bacterium]|nr:right-handed parallel beta-helix repeat-containing protein [Bryobacterales bacterium]MBV9397598.1 right-handed parallel beta-helix repeat-containing protein [Bryobacterales bacterium]
MRCPLRRLPFIFFFSQLIVSAALLRVGPQGQYATPCAAVLAAQDGDIIEIDAAGSYDGDVCAIYSSNLTIRGVNGRPHIDAAGNNAQGKGIWVIYGNNMLIENMEMSGAAVSSHNGTPIRAEGTNLTLRNCYFHNNEEGILADDNLSSTILIEYSEFAQNGFGDGFSHNMYIGNVAQFTLQFSYSHLANVGHLVKSRAAVNYILYNRLTDETGTASYELDLPNGGVSYVIGNVIQQSVTTGNNHMLTYLEEGTTSGNPSEALYVVNNTFFNSLGRGTFVFVDSRDTTPALLENNFFSGGGTVTTQSTAVLTTNLAGTPLYVNSGAYDYQLQAGSPGIDAGTTPGSASGFSLAPAYEYVYNSCGQVRLAAGPIDLGAFEYNGGGPILGCSLNPAGPTLGSLGLQPASVIGGKSTSGNKIALTSPAGPQGVTVALASSDAHASLPLTVRIPPGENSTTFAIHTSPVAASTVATISGTFVGRILSAPLTIQAATSLGSIKLASTSMAGGGTVNGNVVTLSAPAPAGGVTVSLQNGNPAVLSVPQSVTVPEGSISVSFSISAAAVSQVTSVGISASYAGKSSAATITVQPR